MTRLWVYFLAGAAALCLFISSFLLFSSPVQKPAEPVSSYVLKDWGGRLALFRQGESEPVEIYELYTHLLPPADTETLRSGIPLQNEEEVDRLLEDFGA